MLLIYLFRTRIIHGGKIILFCCDKKVLNSFIKMRLIFLNWCYAAIRLLLYSTDKPDPSRPIHRLPECHVWLCNRDGFIPDAGWPYQPWYFQPIPFAPGIHIQRPVAASEKHGQGSGLRVCAQITALLRPQDPRWPPWRAKRRRLVPDSQCPIRINLSHYHFILLCINMLKEAVL